MTVHVPAYTSRELTRRLIRDYLLRHKGQLILVFICMALVAGTTALNAWMMEPVLDDVFLKRDARMLVLVPLAVFVIGLVKGIASYGQSLIMRLLGQRVIADMQIRLFDYLMHADLALFHDQSSGRLISRFSNDIALMRQAFTNAFTGIACESLTFVFLIALMFYQSWELALIAFTVVPVSVWPILKLGRRMRKISDHSQRQLGEFTSHLDETFHGVRVVKAYGRERYEISRASAIVEHLYDLFRKAARLHSATSPLMEILAGVAVSAVIWYGGREVLAGHTTPGAFFSFITAMIMAYRPMKALATLNNTMQEGLSAAQRFYAVLDTPPSITDAPDAKALQLNGGTIEFENASFRYAGAESDAINAIDLTVPAGATVALVGPSGGGKSSIINLILRFYDVQSGAIRIDGQDIRGIALGSLRRHMALVSQDTVLFDDSVRANIAYGRMDASEADVIEAARAAAAHDFIMELPQGYDTAIGPHGVKLSGGQRQRLAIARAMLAATPILLLDEATSALDTESERQVQGALDRLMQGRTTLVVAHRLSTIRNADLIYVIEQGRITESGTHDELIRHQGLYHHLWNQQFSGPTSIDPAEPHVIRQTTAS